MWQMKWALFDKSQGNNWLVEARFLWYHARHAEKLPSPYKEIEFFFTFIFRQLRLGCFFELGYGSRKLDID